MSVVSPDESLAKVRRAFADGGPGARYLTAWALKARGRIARDELTSITPPNGPGAAWLADGLDTLVPGWEAGLAFGQAPPPSSEPTLVRARYALETSGCGEMALGMSLASVKVIEREDNFAHDSIYCVFQSNDGEQLELLQTEVVGPLDAGESATFADGTYFGRQGPRDPGGQVDVDYTCFEQDGAGDYDRLRAVLGEILDAVDATIGRSNPKVKAYIVAARQAIQLLTRIAQALDGDDQLYHATERLDRRALWNLIVEQERTLVMGGTHTGSDWSWQLRLRYTGCAGESASQGGGGGSPSAQCGPETCDGCCVGTTCRPGTDNNQCGGRGAACRTCGPLDACSQGRCQLDQSQTFEVKVIRAEVEPRKANGDCWDFGCGDPDVYVRLAAGGMSGRTGLVRSYNPQWNAVVLTGVEVGRLMDAMEIVVMDDDLQADDVVGRCNPGFSAAQLESGQAAVTCGQARVFLEFRSR